MFTVKLMTLKGRKHSWLRFHKVGDILEINNSSFNYFKDNVKTINMYRMIGSNKICKCCGQIVRNPKRKYLFGKPIKVKI